MAGQAEQRRRAFHMARVETRARNVAWRDVEQFLSAAIQQIGPAEAANLTLGWLQTQLGMTKTLSEVRQELSAPVSVE